MADLRLPRSEFEHVSRLAEPVHRILHRLRRRVCVDARHPDAGVTEERHDHRVVNPLLSEPGRERVTQRVESQAALIP